MLDIYACAKYISGPFPCKAIKNIVWKGTKTWVFICFILEC